jgi:hypothetical protein
MLYTRARSVGGCVSRIIFFFCEVNSACVGTNRDRQHFFFAFFYEVYSACIGTNRDRQQQAGIQ